MNMDNYQSKYAKTQAKSKEDVAKSSFRLRYSIKGLTVGALIMFIYINFYLGQTNPKMIVLGGVLGYFLGGLVGRFFYTKK